MLVHLNIGLTSEAFGVVAANSVLQVLSNHGFFVRTSETIESDTEPTLVAVADFGLLTFSECPHTLAEAVHRISELAGQDCIAVWLPEHRKGRLIGPRAAAWGEFNPKLFIAPNGERLANEDLDPTASGRMVARQAAGVATPITQPNRTTS